MQKIKEITGNLAGRTVGIEIDESSCAVTYLSHDGEIADGFSLESGSAATRHTMRDTRSSLIEPPGCA